MKLLTSCCSALLPLFLITFSPVANAAKIEGTVKAKGDGALGAVVVTACSSSSPLCSKPADQTESDKNGKYALVLAAGSYRIYFYAAGYAGLFYSTEAWSLSPLLSTPVPTVVEVTDSSLTLDPVELTISSSSARFCSEPRQNRPNLESIEAKRPDQSTYSGVALEGSGIPSLLCHITTDGDREKLELLSLAGKTELAGSYPVGTSFKLKLAAPETLQPHLLLAVAELNGGGIEFENDRFTVELKSVKQIAGYPTSSSASRLAFTTLDQSTDLKKLGGDPFKGTVIATNSEFSGEPNASQSKPEFTQKLTLNSDKYLPTDRQIVEVTLPQNFLDWWESPYTLYQASVNGSKSEGTLSGEQGSGGARLTLSFTPKREAEISWRASTKYLQKRPAIKQRSYKPACYGPAAQNVTWFEPNLALRLKIPAYCAEKSTLSATLLSYTRRKIRSLGPRSADAGESTHGWQLPRGLRRGHYVVKLRFRRRGSDISSENFVALRRGAADPYWFAANGRTKHAALSTDLHGTNRNDHLYGYGGQNRLYGRRGNDLLKGGSDNDLLFGGSGVDTLNGGPGADTLSGNSANDYLIGGAEADSINGGTGNDQIHGGDGDDVIHPGDGDDIVAGDKGNDKILERFGNDRLDGGDGDDQIYGARGSDHIAGGAGNDNLNAGPGGDIVAGGDGDDFVVGEIGPDTVTGGEGNDTLLGGANPDYLGGGAGDDKLVGGSDIDTYVAGAGNDYVDSADHQRESVNCGPGEDTVRIYRYKAVLPGSYADEDKLIDCEHVEYVPYSTTVGQDGSSQAGNVISGTGGNDVLRGTDAVDTILGKAGNDSIFGLAGDDVLEGEVGNDRVRGGAGNDTIAGRNGNDFLWGNEGDDRIDGNRGRDRIDGGPGNDVLRGGFGTDVIYGGAGDDRIVTVGPRKEGDRVSCGAGVDTAHVDGGDFVTPSCEKVVRN